ncbi:MAG: diaminopimelate epimerase, partial [Acidocella sp. 21-58-7]
MSGVSDDTAFVKMHGAGNDFVVLDARAGTLGLTKPAARLIADRRLGIGCDQIIIIEPDPEADAFMRILNADGSESGACGNATRCVAALLAEETG